jgi:hypothetical protein
METIIVKQNGNELIKADLKFRVLTNGKGYDIFIYDKYSLVMQRLSTLKRLFKFSTHEILVIEK